MSDKLEIRNMTRPEVTKLVEWAAGEGWNPGLHDADVFWATDSEAFVAAELAGELIGGGAITAYGSEFGFMGFFIVRPPFRGRGFGDRLWHARRERLIGRLAPNATIGMDGVFAMQSYYARGGFVFSHRDLRFSTEVPAGGMPQVGDGAPIKPLARFPFDVVQAYDRRCFPAARPAFLEGWVSQPDSLALGCEREGRFRGFGVVRRCQQGCKVGPLFADDLSIADALLTRLAAFAAGGPMFLDVPENNPSAMKLARQHEMTEVFGCARMYLGPMPDLDHHCVFGVTTFELG